MIDYTQKHSKHKKILSIRWDEKSLQTAINMRNEGHKIKHIARALGVMPSRVSDKLSKIKK